MKYSERQLALTMRAKGMSIKHIANELNVAKSSVSVWVRGIDLTEAQKSSLNNAPFTSVAIEKRRLSRIKNEELKRQIIIDRSKKDIRPLSLYELKLVGTSLYWAEGGKTRRMVRFSNGDPEMIKLMMTYFRTVCEVPESKFRGYIHIHDHLDHVRAENYWSNVTGINLDHFFKTYRKANVNIQNKKDTLPYGVLDVYVLDSSLFLKIHGWTNGIVTKSVRLNGADERT